MTPRRVAIEVPDTSLEDTERNRVFVGTWKRKDRKKFVRDLSGFLEESGVLGLEPDVLLWLLQFSVQNRDLMESVTKLAVKFRHNIPRMSVEDMRTAIDEAKVRSVMEG